MNTRTTENRLDDILAEWANGFDVNKLLDNLLSADHKGEFACIGLRILAFDGISNAKIFKLISILEQSTKSREYKQSPETRNKLAALLCQSQTHGRHATIGDYATNKQGDVTDGIRNDYVRILETVLMNTELTQEQFITLLARHPSTKGSQNERLANLPKLLLEREDLHNLNCYFNIVNALMRDEKITDETVKTIFKTFAEIKLGNRMIDAHKKPSERKKSKPHLAAMLGFIEFMETAHTKYGCNHEMLFDNTLSLESAAYFQKEEIFKELTAKAVDDMSLPELYAREALLKNMRNGKHPLGFITHLQRGGTKCDEYSGVLRDARYAYNATRIEIFFKESALLPLQDRLQKCKRAKDNRSSDEYRIMEKPTSIHDSDDDIPRKLHRRLANEIQHIETQIKKFGPTYATPSAPPRTLDLGQDCNSVAGRAMLELIAYAKAFNLPKAKQQFNDFVSINTELDVKRICEIFESEAADEIVEMRNVELTARLLATLTAVAATNPELAFSVSAILGKPRTATGCNLLYMALRSPKDGVTLHKQSSRQLHPTMQLLNVLSNQTALDHSGVISLLGMKTQDEYIPAISIAAVFDNESNSEFIKFLKQLCSSRENAQDILTMLQTNPKCGTFGNVLCKYHDTEALLDFLLLLDKITVEYGVPFNFETVLPSSIDSLRCSVKRHLFTLIENLYEKDNPSVDDLELCTRLSLCALDENHPLGHIMYIQRDITKPRIDTGTRKQFGELLHKAQQRLDELKRSQPMQTSITEMHVSQIAEPVDEVTPPPSYEESQRLYAPRFFAVQTPIAPSSNEAEWDKIASSPYLKIAEAEFHATAPAIVEPELTPSAPLSINNRSVLDLLFSDNHLQAEVLVPTSNHSAPESGCAIGNLSELDSLPSEASTSSPVMDSLLGIDFSAPAPAPAPAQDDSSEDILAKLEALESPPQHTPNTVLFQQRKEEEKPAPKKEEKRKVLSHAN